MSSTSSISRARSRQPVVTVRLGGGLGNQLFQYAFGRRMSLANGAELCIDASGYQNTVTPIPEQGIRMLGLDHFGICATLVRRRPDVRQPQGWMQRKIIKYWNRLKGLREELKPYYLRREVVEAEDRYFTFDKNVYSRRIHGNVIFNGYWQTEKYFSDIEEVLRGELIVRDELDMPNARLARVIAATDSVSIHVRHGDNARSTHGVLPLEYFRGAISQLARDVPQPHFFVFSDDIPWAEQMLVPESPTTFVTHNGDVRDYEDLRLMSMCKHHIVGNSSFSWWGAWLGKKDGQIVYAPHRYYQGMDRPNPDLYPDGWRLI